MINKIWGEGITFDDVLLIPQKTSVNSRSEIDISGQLTPRIKLQVPVVAANMDTVTESQMAIAMAQVGGIGFIHRFLSIEDQVGEVALVKKAKLRVGAAIGVKDDFLRRAEALLGAKVDILLIDVAHGHSSQLIKALRKLKKAFPKVEVIAGNIATAEAAEELIKSGADALKVGIGPGSLCSTRIVTGAGVPQITAIMECLKIASKANIPIIADGGIRYSGDIVKALAAGASSVMIGSMFAGCDESPAFLVKRGDKKYKLTRGMASIAANKDRAQKDGMIKKDLEEYAQEGVEGLVPYRGSVVSLIKKMASGVRSGFSYCGAKNMTELWRKSQFIKISHSGLIESHPHDIEVL